MPSRQSCFSVGKQRTATTIEPLFFDNCVFLTGTQRRRGLAIRLAPRLAPGRVPGVGVARRPHVVTREIVVELRELDLFDQGACPAMASTRRLAAILAADVAGYSRLMGGDEEGTHERLKAHLRELVDPKIGEHKGRIVKNTGDGAGSRNFRVSSMPSAVPRRSSVGWLTASPTCLRSGASSFASG